MTSSTYVIYEIDLENLRSLASAMYVDLPETAQTLSTLIGSIKEREIGKHDYVHSGHGHCLVCHIGVSAHNKHWLPQPPCLGIRVGK